MQTKTCGKCLLYSYSLKRCKLGKVNPRTKKGTLEVVAFGSWTDVCIWNKWRQKMAPEGRLVARDSDVDLAEYRGGDYGND
jgi:hypothetical protein